MVLNKMRYMFIKLLKFNAFLPAFFNEKMVYVQGIILMAATNLPDILDPALTRPGRFDRHVSSFDYIDYSSENVFIKNIFGN